MAMVVHSGGHSHRAGWGTILVHNYRWALLSSYLSVGSPSMLLSTLPASHVELTTLTPPSHIVQSVPQYTIRRKSTSRSHRLHLQVDAKTVDSTQVTRLGQNTVAEYNGVHQQVEAEDNSTSETVELALAWVMLPSFSTGAGGRQRRPGVRCSYMAAAA